MVVYRCVSEREIASMVGIPNELSAPRGSNDFNYEKNIEYRHFFYYIDSAVSFMEIQNNERYYNKYALIMAYNIDDEILKNHFGLGRYNLGCVRKDLKDKVLQYFEKIYFPEFAIPVSLITSDMIVGIGNNKRITPINNIYYNEMNDIILKSERDFIEYERWLFLNGTNVSKGKVLENSKALFPIGEDNRKL